MSAPARSADGDGGARAHHLAIRVYYEDTDLAGVVYHANYLRFLERGRSEAIRALGIDQRALREAGIVFVVRAIRAEFLRPARYDDLLGVATALSEITAARLVMDQRIARGAELLLTARVTLACMTPQGRPRRIPAPVRAALAAALAPPPAGDGISGTAI
ncbi:MAG: tol-pal system-associated acyl-CoA thioesterase [Alphaproteobacteria bacterium]|nr:MAG: tol-pal system-associated acyl-CoA thioesterase [Alphaproteobacteria bacterium]